MSCLPCVPECANGDPYGFPAKEIAGDGFCYALCAHARDTEDTVRNNRLPHHDPDLAQTRRPSIFLDNALRDRQTWKWTTKPDVAAC